MSFLRIEESRDSSLLTPKYLEEMLREGEWVRALKVFPY